jgi:hypothetical protein
MYLNEQERAVFFRLYFDLLYCVNEEHKIVSDVAESRRPKSVDSQKAIQVRKKLFENPAWIDDYIQKHETEFTGDEKEILISWRRYFITGEFFIMRYLTKYAVLMTAGNENTTRLYGITGLNHPFADLIDKSYLPVLINALFLPFRDKIIYDGLITMANVSFGPGMRKNFSELYASSKGKFGIITQLPFDDSRPKEIRESMPKTLARTKPNEVQERVGAIKSIIAAFCEEKLGSEFADVCFHVLEKLSRKRPSPLLSGNDYTWACGIVYAIAANNFVFDKSQPYYMPAQDIADGFGLSKSTAQNKGSQISKMLNISYFTPEYMIERLRKQSQGFLNSMAEMETLFRRLP